MLTIKNLHDFTTGAKQFNLFKIYFDQTIDYIKIENTKIVSVIDDKIYDENIKFKAIGLQLDLHEVKFAKKFKYILNVPQLNIPQADFFLARALKVAPTKIIKENAREILQLYKDKLIAFVKAHTGTSPVHFTVLDYDRISSINDFSVLIQFFPKDEYFYTTKFEHNTQLKYLNAIRQRLYQLLFFTEQNFIDLYDKDLLWIDSCKLFFEIPDIQYSDFDKTNFSHLQEIKNKWLHQIKLSRTNALNFLFEEKELAKSCDDTLMLKEMDVIIEELEKSVSLEKVHEDLTSKKTIREVFGYWPELLAPAPVQYYSK